jgi:multidrug efflux pump subunit AcrB
VSHTPDRELIANTHNTARYFTETRHVSWVLLVATVILGFFAYARMPKRKDPFIKIRAAVAVCAWPGAPPEKVEDLITRRIEERIAQNPEVERIESSSRTGVSVVTVTLREDLPTPDIAKALDDIDLKLRGISDLPSGALPVDFQKDFGDTAALMLTVASPKVRPVERSLRAAALADALGRERGAEADRRALVLAFPGSVNPAPLRRVVGLFETFARASGRARDLRLVEAPGFLALDGRVDSDAVWASLAQEFLTGRLRASQFHPDVSRPFVVGDLAGTEAALAAAGGDAYSHRELDELTEGLARRLRAVTSVAKVTRTGLVGERIYLDFSQERFAQLGVTQAQLRDALAARNVQVPGGSVEVGGRNVTIDATGEFQGIDEIGDTLVSTTATGTPVYVRDLVEVSRDYENPARLLNFHTWRGPDGAFQTSRAVTLAVQMKAGEQIARFSDEVNGALADARRTLPDDLVVVRTSDQPRQVEQKVGLFLKSLYEAIAIIVVIGFVGFREWRSALVLALSIPLTLAMTFLFMWGLGIDIQQMSIAALILALGLLVDDPVVAGDAIKRELDDGHPREIAAWLGPTKLARAILFATITNIVAYLPFLIMQGDVGRFIYSLPVVLACSLVASRLVSMTFIPLLGYALLRGHTGPTSDPDRGLLGAYRRFVGWAIDHRHLALAASTLVLVAGGAAGRHLKSSFFPKDLSHLSYVDISLPEDSSLAATTRVAEEASAVIREAAVEFGRRHPGPSGARPVLGALTTFVGGGAPRFWYSLSPAQQQPNYAQIVVELQDDHDTTEFIAPLQIALTSRVPGARIDVRQLENGKPVPSPVEIRFSGDDPATLRSLAERARRILEEVPTAERVRDDWGQGSFRVQLATDPTRATLAGVSGLDVALASSAGFNGAFIGGLREGDRRIPIVTRLRAEERASASDLRDLYVSSSRGASRVPLGQVARISLHEGPERIARRDQLRTISVAAFPAADRLPSEVMSAARPRLAALAASLPPGYRMEIGGAEENVVKVSRESAVVAIVSMLGILLALVIQFRNAIKPLIVLAAIPYGGAGAVLAIVAMGAPFGFTAILGVISLIGVIVSHIIVLFDYIEEMNERGEPLRDALLDAGTIRLRPVLITVGATVLGLVPLALHGGPLWEPLCYAQIGGLTLATAITLVLVPVLYATFVLDLRWVTWGADAAPTSGEDPRPLPPHGLVPTPGGE